MTVYSDRSTRSDRRETRERRRELYQCLGRTLQFIIPTIVHGCRTIPCFMLFRRCASTSIKFPKGKHGHGRVFWSKLRPRRIFARRYDFSFIALAWTITKKSNYFRCGRVCARARLYRKYIFSTPQALHPSVGRAKCLWMIHKVIENFICVMYTTASNQEFATDFK